jgi:quinol monooxygenase YgiN
MPESCVVIATFHPHPGKRDAVRAALEAVIPDVHKETGCELYALHEETEGRLILIEKWTTRELWQEHLTLEPVKRSRASLEGLLESATEVLEMYGAAAGTPQQGSL